MTTGLHFEIEGSLYIFPYFYYLNVKQHIENPFNFGDKKKTLQRVNGNAGVAIYNNGGHFGY